MPIHPLSRHFPRIPAVVLLALALAACGNGADGDAAGKAGDAGKAKAPTAATPSLTVTLAPVASRTLARGVVASGPVAAWEEMQLGVEVTGLRVTALRVDVGQQVARGQVLLELDHRTLDSELRQAEAAHAEAAAGVQLAQVNLRRGEALASSKLISASALDELRAALVQAQAREATTAAQRDGVRLRRDYATLRAPDAGIISKRLVQPGQVVAAGTELLRLIRGGRLEWRPALSEAELARVSAGDDVLLHDPTGAEVHGRVRAISPGVDADTRTGTIYVDLPEPAGLRAGAFVQGRVLTSSAPGLVVPAASVLMRDGYAYVFTVDANAVAHRVRVRLGERVGDVVEVLAGVKAGDRVVASGAGFLAEGDHVRVVDVRVAAGTPAP
jgi:RND family efflux transporter MFP subunit